MAKQSGLGDALYVGGYDLSGDIGSLSRIGGGPSPLDVTAIDKSGVERIGGLRDGSMEFSAFFNPSANQAHARLSTLPTTDVTLTYCRGTAFGSPAAALVGKQVNYDPTRGQDGSLTFGVTAQANGFGIEWGDLLTAGKRTDTGATLGPSTQDNGAETAFGCQAYLQVFAFTGTDATIVVRGASDSGFTTGLQDQATFVVTAGPSAQRVTGLSTVRQFVKVNTSTTGGFSLLTFALVFVRNGSTTSF